MGKSRKGIFFFQNFYLFKNKTMIITLSCQNNCKKMVIDFSNLMDEIDKLNTEYF